MSDPGLLHLPSGHFVTVDLDVLRDRLPGEHRRALDGGPVPAVVAGYLWSRSYDSYEQRAFFLDAVTSGGFEVQRLDPLHLALQWMQEAGAVVRWYDEQGAPHLRVSARDDADEVFVVQGALVGDGARALVVAAQQLRDDLRARGVRRRLRLVGASEPEQ